LAKERTVRQTLRRSDRVRRKKEIDRLFREGEVVRGPLFRVHALRRDPPVTRSARAAFVAGKRIGKSVVRSRIRRLLREAFRRIKGELRAEPVDLVFVASRDISGLGSAQVADEMRAVLLRAGLLDRAPRDPGDGQP
jgi:ribonuclease P protein component